MNIRIAATAMAFALATVSLASCAPETQATQDAQTVQATQWRTEDPGFWRDKFLAAPGTTAWAMRQCGVDIAGGDTEADRACIVSTIEREQERVTNWMTGALTMGHLYQSANGNAKEVTEGAMPTCAQRGFTSENIDGQRCVRAVAECRLHASVPDNCINNVLAEDLPSSPRWQS